MRTRLPLALGSAIAALMLVAFFSPPMKSAYGGRIGTGLYIFIAFATIPGAVGLVRLHATRIKRRHGSAVYSAVTLVALAATIGLGIADGKYNGPQFRWIYLNVFSPLQKTVFSFLAFFIVSAAYRAFRARSLEATLLLAAAVVVLVGNAVVSIPLPGGPAEGWLLTVPAMAMQRGIVLGVALGMISQSVRILLGLERGFVGRG